MCEGAIHGDITAGREEIVMGGRSNIGTQLSSLSTHAPDHTPLQALSTLADLNKNYFHIRSASSDVHCSPCVPSSPDNGRLRVIGARTDGG